MESLKRFKMTDDEACDISSDSSNKPCELGTSTSRITKKGIIEKLFPVNLKVRFLLRGFSRQNNSPEKQQPKT